MCTLHFSLSGNRDRVELNCPLLPNALKTDFLFFLSPFYLVSYFITLLHSFSLSVIRPGTSYKMSGITQAERQKYAEIFQARGHVNGYMSGK